jgi:hypothetical protein
MKAGGVVCLLCVGLVCGGLGISTVFYALHDGQNKCISVNSLPCSTWLVMDGFLLLMISAMVFLSVSIEWPRLDNFSAYSWLFLGCALIECIWHVVGTYEFFTQVDKTCRGTEIYAYGWIIFALQSIASIFILVLLLLVLCVYVVQATVQTARE